MKPGFCISVDVWIMQGGWPGLSVVPWTGELVLWGMKNSNIFKRANEAKSLHTLVELVILSDNPSLERSLSQAGDPSAWISSSAYFPFPIMLPRCLTKFIFLEAEFCWTPLLWTESHNFLCLCRAHSFGLCSKHREHYILKLLVSVMFLQEFIILIQMFLCFRGDWLVHIQAPSFLLPADFTSGLLGY